MFCALALFLFLPLPDLRTGAHPQQAKCGGLLEDAHGVIATPDFPRKFDTPIHCVWQIDAQRRKLEDDRVRIKLYLTQLYVFAGLTITEYQSRNVFDFLPAKGSVVLALEERDATSNKTYIEIAADNEFVLLEFQLQEPHLESVHLRVLDGLLDVYGFNITYEITADPPRPNRCSMRLCGFTGYCYDDFTHFTCECFPGFHGKRCSDGPKSKCIVDGEPVCKNGGQCLHAGHTAFACDCLPGFEEPFCEHPNSPPTALSGCAQNPHCLTACKFNGTIEDVCRCSDQSQSENLRAINESSGFSTQIFVQSDLRQDELANMLKRNFYNAVQLNISTIDDINIILTKRTHNETEVTLRFYASKSQDDTVRNAIRKWAREEYARTDRRYTSTEKEVLVFAEPHLHLKSIVIDKSGPISEGEDFLITCTARGSTFMVFHWFKDGALVNITRATTNKWTDLISNRDDKKNHYTAMLSLRHAKRFDGGTYTCHVQDYGIQHCRSLHVDMIYQPQIKLEPASLTVQKGESFTIKCISLATRGEKYNFSWSRDRTLLKIRTEWEHYEILYPGGSILHVAHLNKTTTYSCLANLDKLNAERSIVVHVVDRHVVRTCPTEQFEGFAWPATATDSLSLQDCPERYVGVVQRSCIVLENGDARWQLPDYSNCTHEWLLPWLSDFRYLEESYAKTTPLRTLEHLKAYAEKSRMLRGEGRVLLSYMERVALFNNASRGYSEHGVVTDVILEIADAVLSQNISLNKEEHLVQLQKLLRNQLFTLCANIRRAYAKNLHNLQVQIDIDDSSLTAACSIRIDYDNLYAFLTKKSIIRLNSSDDREMHYDLFAGVASIWRLHLARNSVGSSIQHPISHAFPHHQTIGAPLTRSVLLCVLAEFAASNYVWDSTVCHMTSANKTHVSCQCDHDGTMTILQVDNLMSNDPTTSSTAALDEMLMISCAASSATFFIAAVLLVVHWANHHSTMLFLKVQCVLALACCHLLFVLGFADAIAKRFYLHILSTLLLCYLTAMSSQLSTLLIIYADLMDLHKVIPSVQQTVVGITSGAPLIATIANHLAHQIKGIPLAHWWIVRDTLSFYVLVVCTTVLFVLYVTLGCMVTKLIRTDKTKSDRLLRSRARKTTKSILVLIVVLLSTGTSVFCVNDPHHYAGHYLFASIAILMVVVVFSCLVFKRNMFSRKRLLETMKRSKKEAYLKKGHTHKESKPAGNDCPHITHNKCDGNNIDVLLENAFPTLSLDEGKERTTRRQCNSEHKVHKSNTLNSPDILGTKVFADLDLVASSMRLDSSEEDVQDSTKIANYSQNDAISAVGKEKVQKTDKCVTFCDQVDYDINDTNVATIENNERSSSCEQFHTPVDKNLDEVLDGISNDLKYLLNGNQCVDPINSISC